MPSRDPVLSLAFTLASSPGSYAALLGAGTSATANVLTAWGVQQDLIEKVARVRGDTPTDLMAWYAENFGCEATYDDLLERLAPTTFERHALLRGYFEGSGDDRPTPSPAHTALARLAATGHIKVFLTTNFDHLLEMALRQEGIEPTVVSSPDAITGLAPLHLLDCLVVHLHGDYLTPTAMLNTTDELGAYDDRLDVLLDRILADYGLLIAGWSATWDAALRAAIARRSARRYSTYWVEPYAQSEEAVMLRTAQGVEVLTLNADEFCGRLLDAVRAIRDSTPDPMTRPTAVATAKRELSGREVAVRLHDQLRREHEKVIDTAHRLSDPQAQGSADLGALEDAMQVYLALIATTAYWGTPSTDQWWMSDFERLAAPRIGASGLTSIIKLKQIPAMYALHAAGVAAVASQRYDLLGTLLGDQPTLTPLGSHPRPLHHGSPQRELGVTRASAHVYDYLAPMFVEDLALGENGYRDAWERFEYLRLLAATDYGLRHDGGWGSDLPHIRATGHLDHHEPVPAAWLRALNSSARTALFNAGAFDGEPVNLDAAVDKYGDAFNKMADQAAWSVLAPGSAGFLPSGLFQPDEMPMWSK